MTRLNNLRRTPSAPHGSTWCSLRVRVFMVSVALFAFYVTWAATASAFNVFGVLAYNFKKYGSSVSIEVPPSDPAPSSYEFVVHRAIVQSDYTSTAGLVQLGVFRSASNLGLDYCGSRTGWTFFGEWKAAGTANEPNSYHCQFFSETDHGNNTVEHIWRKGEASTNEWEMEINNGRVATYKPSFGSGYPQIGGEIAAAHDAPALSKTHTWYGSTRTWHSWSQIGKGEEFTITNPANTNIVQDADWYVEPINYGYPIVIEHIP